MRKSMMVICSLSLIILLFLSSCQPKPQVPEEEALAQLEGLSDEERDAALAKSGALAGQAYKAFSPEKVQRVKSVRQVAKSFNWLECTDSDGGVNNEVVGTATVKYTYGGGPVKEISFTDICQQGTNLLVEYYCKNNNYATATANCQYGCELVTPTSGRCKEASFVVAPPGPSEAVCGDGMVTGDEQCDYPDHAGKTCQDFGFPSGKLGCKQDCTWYLNACVKGKPDLIVADVSSYYHVNKSNFVRGFDVEIVATIKNIGDGVVTAEDLGKTQLDFDGGGSQRINLPNKELLPGTSILVSSRFSCGYYLAIDRNLLVDPHPQQVDESNELNNWKSHFVNCKEFCGNNKVEGNEQCDDGNVKDGDGCSAMCKLPPAPQPLPVNNVSNSSSPPVNNGSNSSNSS